MLRRHAVKAPEFRRGPWIMEQTWSHLLFAHWPCVPDALRACLPAGLTLDTYDGRAWVGIVAFGLSGVRLRGLPPLPPVDRFPEVNVRTYVTRDGRPGVLFLSLDAPNRAAIALARPWFHLAYVLAGVRMQAGPAGVRFASRRPGPDGPAFAATYGPCGPPCQIAPGSLAAWLTERYCYYAASPSGRLYRCDIAHAPWDLQPATARITANSLPAAHGLTVSPEPPLLHCARHMRARIWPARRLPAAVTLAASTDVYGPSTRSLASGA